MVRRKIIVLVISFSLVFSGIVGYLKQPVKAASFTEFSIRPSRIEVSVTDVNFLIKADAVSSATEDAVQVTFGTGYTVDGTPANITVTTTGISSWDAECTNAWPGIGSAATGVSGNVVTFASTSLTQTNVYCFIITAGIDNPSSPGNYDITVASRESSADVDTGTMTLPIVDDDEITITASVGTFVRCDVTTTSGSDNAVALGGLAYGTVTSSTDDIQIQGGTNAGEGMAWFYRSDASNNGLYSSSQTDLLDGASAEDTISATTADCDSSNPCFGIYYNGTTTADSGAFTADADFTGGTVTTDVGPLTTQTYGEEVGNTGAAEASQVTADFNVNATAAENSATASDYTETLIFTCKADI
jgi:hypothetical protein